jgi:hypothetical protein
MPDRSAPTGREPDQLTENHDHDQHCREVQHDIGQHFGATAHEAVLTQPLLDRLV